jgi:hypothetical protein
MDRIFTGKIGTSLILLGLGALFYIVIMGQFVGSWTRVTVEVIDVDPESRTIRVLHYATDARYSVYRPDDGGYEALEFRRLDPPVDEFRYVVERALSLDRIYNERPGDWEAFITAEPGDRFLIVEQRDEILWAEDPRRPWVWAALGFLAVFCGLGAVNLCYGIWRPAMSRDGA